jgi:muramoyltetrapeptide carboxypeptidase LdcA involved in peptidoglycan recycling
MQKPNNLRKGDNLAIICPSWGGSSVCPHIYNSGISNLKRLGFNIIEFPTTKMSVEEVYNNPKARAEDINNAFKDPNIHGIISVIGGDDSVRILKYLDIKSIVKNPKFIMGYSDFTTISTYLNQHGLITFNGPSVMAGFSQLQSFDSEYQNYIHDFFFNSPKTQSFPTFSKYSEGYPDWKNKEFIGQIKKSKHNDGWHWLQGTKKTSGSLFGGCVEVLEMLKGTRFWPAKEFWKDRVLFLETSEDKPSINYVKYTLRNYGVMGIFDHISAVLIGRARSYTDDEKVKLEQTVLSIIKGEFGNSVLPIVCNLDFGHTDPQVILPLGVMIEINPIDKQIKFLESAFADNF